MWNRDQCAQLFVQEIARWFLEKSIRIIFRLLEQGPMRNEGFSSQPQAALVLRQWFENLSEEDAHNVRAVVVDTAWAFFHSLCYFFDGGGSLTLQDGREILFPIQMEAYETEDDWLERRLPTWKVRVSPVEQGWLLQDAEWECVVEVVRRNRWELYLGIEPDPEALAEVPFEGQPFKVGEYYQLRREARGTCMEAHMVPHGYMARQLIASFRYETAPAVLLPAEVHYGLHKSNPLPTVESPNSDGGTLVLDREGAALLFLNELWSEVFVQTVHEIERSLTRGPSWNPPADTTDPIARRALELHHWYTHLSEQNKRSVLALVQYTIEIGFHTLCYFLDGGIYIPYQHEGEVEFAVYLELYDQGSQSPSWSVKICPAKGDGWDLHEVVGDFTSAG